MKAFTMLERFFRINTINKKFSYSIIALIIFLMVVSTVVDVQMKISQGKKDIADKGDAIVKLASVALIDPVWNFNNEGIKLGVESLFNDKEVYSVTVTDQNNKELFKKTRDNAGYKKAGLTSEKSGITKDGKNIGNIEVAITGYYLNQKIGQDLLTSIINNAVMVILLIILIFLVSRAVTKPLKELISVSDRISGGDLESRSSVKSNDEIGVLSGQFNKMAENICDSMSQLKETGSNLESYVGRLKDTYSTIMEISSNVSQSSGDLAASGEELNATIEEITSYANQISQVVTGLFEATAETNRKSDGIMEVSSQGREIVKETISKINAVAKAFEDIDEKVKVLNKQSMEIKKFTGIISNITSQTNLIALNAAIEAARAGEYGRGFAVVADEIRKLSEQSTIATTEINQLINHIDSGMKETIMSTEKGRLEVRDGVDLTIRAGESLEEISGAINEAILLIKEIEEKSKDADSGVRQVATSCEDFAKAIEQVAVSSQYLSGLSEKLHIAATNTDAV